MWSSFVRLFSVLAVTLGAALVVPVASVDASCGGQSCNGKSISVAGSYDCSVGASIVKQMQQGEIQINLYNSPSCVATYSWILRTSSISTAVLYANQETPSGAVNAGRTCNNCTSRTSYMWDRVPSVRGYGTYRIAPNPGMSIRTAFYP
jgi:hypothetical protein